MLELRAVLGKLWTARDAVDAATRTADLPADLAVRFDLARLELDACARAVERATPDALDASRDFWRELLRAREGDSGLAEHDRALLAGTLRPGRGGGRSSRRWKESRGGR